MCVKVQHHILTFGDFVPHNVCWWKRLQLNKVIANDFLLLWHTCSSVNRILRPPSQPLQTLFTSWQLMPQPQHPCPPRGRMENCKTNLNQRGWKRRRKRRAGQQPLTTTAPRTEPEKEGSVNRTVTSSLPSPSFCILTPALLYTLSLIPSLLSHLHPSWLSSPPRCQKKKRRDAETPAGLQNVQNLLTNPVLFHLFKTTEYDAKTKNQTENRVRKLMMTVNPRSFETQIARRSTGRI